MAALNLAGKTSGYIKLKSPDVALNATVELPNKDGILATLDDVGSGGGGVPEAPTDGKQYARQDENWTEVNHPTRLESNRNLLINGDMRIAQRGTSASGITSSGYHSIDRQLFVIDGLGTWTISQDSDVPTGQGFAKSLKLQCTTANASPTANQTLNSTYRFEGQDLQHLKKGTSNAESVTLSFWAKSNKTGTYIIELFDSDNNRQISKSYTIDTANTWEKKTITFAGDTTGAFDNDNANSLVLTFWLGAGSTFTSGTLNTSWASNTNANRVVGQVNLADSTSNYINITGVQLEVGDTATPFEHRPYDLELQRCQRYYQMIRYIYLGASLDLTSGTTIKNWRAMLTYSTPMRASPTITYGSIDDKFTIVNLLTESEHLIYECGTTTPTTDFRPAVATPTTISAEL